MQSKYDRGYQDEGQGLVELGTAHDAVPKTTAQPKYGDDDDLLPVVLERYLEKAGVM